MVFPLEIHCVVVLLCAQRALGKLAFGWLARWHKCVSLNLEPRGSFTHNCGSTATDTQFWRFCFQCLRSSRQKLLPGIARQQQQQKVWSIEAATTLLHPTRLPRVTNEVMVCWLRLRAGRLSSPGERAKGRESWKKVEFTVVECESESSH